MRKIILLFLFFVGFFYACKEPLKVKDPLQLVLASNNSKIKRVMDSLDTYELQIIYTQIDRFGDSITFTDFEFQVNDENYFYPASTVKFPIAILALEKIFKTDSLSLDTRYFVEGDTIESTFAQDIIQIFAVSDNLANNRLVDLLGQDYCNATLKNRNIGPARIAHRLGHHSESLKTKPLIIYLNDSTTAMTTPSFNTAPEPLKLNAIKKGIGYMDEDGLVKMPFDFSLKNYLPLTSQHNLLKRIIFPEKFSKTEQFSLGKTEREFLLNAMGNVPRDVGYNENEFFDGYCKFFLFGDSNQRIPENIKMYNKVGFAYGTLTDCAYIKDSKNNLEFMVTATILVNRDSIFNDDNYDYETIGIPFLAQLGRELYEVELKRK